ncbi:MAG: ASCH domain-containing protein [Chloroflexota bacterium]
MKALTIRQPWAWLIVNGYKTVENRSWATSYRGPLAIHAGQKIERLVIEDLIAQWTADGEAPSEAELQEMRTTGATIGVVELVDCTLTPTEPNDVEWRSPGNYAWVLREPRVLDTPVPMKGRLGLFSVDLGGGGV